MVPGSHSAWEAWERAVEKAGSEGKREGGRNDEDCLGQLDRLSRGDTIGIRVREYRGGSRDRMLE